MAPYCRQPTSKALKYGNALSRDPTVLPTQFIYLYIGYLFSRMLKPKFINLSAVKEMNRLVWILNIL